LPEESLLSISEASQLIGVSETTLRQWTDEGKIKAFITPGGHRRYYRLDLKRFIGSHSKAIGMKDLAFELEDTARILRETPKASLSATPWYSNLDEKTKTYLAHLGRQLLDLIIKYITVPARREDTAKLIRETGNNLGDTLAKLELPLTDSVEAFLLHRDPIMNAVAHLIKKREAYAGRVVVAIPMVAHALDEALLALIAAHQRHRNGVQVESTRSTSI
jgi:excisionase family DNA binding protein